MRNILIGALVVAALSAGLAGSVSSSQKPSWPEMVINKLMGSNYPPPLATAPTVLPPEEDRLPMVTFTFDDASIGQYTYGLAIARKYGVTGTFFPVVRNVNEASLGRSPWSMNWDNVRAFAAAGWEIGAHTYSHPYLAQHLEKENVADLQMELEYPIDKIEQEIGVRPVDFATPYGDYDAFVLHYVQAFYQSHLMIWGQGSGVNSALAADHYKITRFPIDNTVDAGDVCARIQDQAAKKSDTWFVMVFHQISSDDSTERFSYTASAFEKIVSCAATLAQDKKIKILTVKDALARIPSSTAVAAK